MNIELILTITVCIFIAALVTNICKIFIKCMIFIAKGIANDLATVDFKTDLIIVMGCTLIICAYFLI